MTGIKAVAEALHVNSSMNKLKINKCELPIHDLKTGVEVDLSGQDLLVEDAIIIAACINVSSSSMTSVDLSSNELTGKDRYGKPLGDMTGVKAIADALGVSTSMNSLK